jgi:hypothetical protein
MANMASGLTLAGTPVIAPVMTMLEISIFTRRRRFSVPARDRV